MLLKNYINVNKRKYSWKNKTFKLKINFIGIMYPTYIFRNIKQRKTLRLDTSNIASWQNEEFFFCNLHNNKLCLHIIVLKFK